MSPKKWSFRCWIKGINWHGQSSLYSHVIDKFKFYLSIGLQRTVSKCNVFVLVMHVVEGSSCAVQWSTMHFDAPATCIIMHLMLLHPWHFDSQREPKTFVKQLKTPASPLNDLAYVIFALAYTHPLGLPPSKLRDAIKHKFVCSLTKYCQNAGAYYIALYKKNAILYMYNKICQHSRTPGEMF